MKKIMISLTIITMIFCIFPAYASMQVVQFDTSSVVPPEQIDITINNNSAGDFTVVNYKNTLFIDSNFFKYYFGVTSDELNNNVAYGGTIGSGDDQVLCVPFLPILSSMGVKYSTDSAVGKYVICISAPANTPNSDQQKNAEGNVTYNNYGTTPSTVYVDNNDPYYYPGVGLATGIAIGAALTDNTYVYRGFDIDNPYIIRHTNWNHVVYNGSVYHSGTTVWGNNGVVHRGVTAGDDGALVHRGSTWRGDDAVVHTGSTWGNDGDIHHAGATWENNGQIHHAGGTWGSGGGFHGHRR